MLNSEYSDNAKIKYISKTTKYCDETGEHEMTETDVYKKYYGGPHFYRVWLSDLLYHLNLISNSRQMDVLFYILDNVNSDNLFIGTNRSIAEATKASTKTVNTIIKKMVENDLMKVKQRGVYMIKPTLLMKGDNVKKHKMTIVYEQIRNQNIDADNKNEKQSDNQLAFTEDGQLVDETTGEIINPLPQTGTGNR